MIWDATNTPPKAIYQDWGRRGLSMEMATIGGRVYAFHSSVRRVTGDQSLHVYDVTAAAAAGATTPCAQDTVTGAGSTCAGVYKGNLGAFLEETFLDVFQPDGPTGPTYIAHTDNGFDGIEILEMQNMSTLQATQSLRASGGGPYSGVQLFEYDDTYFLALALGNDLNIYDVTTCLQQGGCHHPSGYGLVGGPQGDGRVPDPSHL